MKRNLCGIYFRIERNGRYQNICFTDMTREERDKVMKEQSKECLKGICHRLTEVINEFAEVYDFVRE